MEFFLTVGRMKRIEENNVDRDVLLTMSLSPKRVEGVACKNRRKIFTSIAAFPV